MVRYIVKIDPELDYYARFCTVVGDFLEGGSRAWWATRVEEWPGEYAAERFERADANGTSEFPQIEGGMGFSWAERDFFLNRGMSTGWMLKREDVIEYLRRKRAREDVEELLEPVEGE